MDPHPWLNQPSPTLSPQFQSQSIATPAKHALECPSTHGEIATYDLLSGPHCIGFNHLAGGALPLPLSSTFLERALAGCAGSRLLLGAFHHSGKSTTNAAFVLGNQPQVQNKEKLVPFGEQLPLAAILAPIMRQLHLPMSSLAPGENASEHLRLAGHTAALFICYELAFPALVQHRMRGAEFAVVMSELGWMNHSTASEQHLQMAEFYAMMTQRPWIYVSNQGALATITPNKNPHIQRSLPGQQVWTTHIQPTQPHTGRSQ